MTDTVSSKLNNMLTFVPQSHEKALKQAFYNIAAILFVIVAIAAAVAVFYIMEPFLSPLLWAILFGSVLHPIKQRLTDVVKMWFGGLHASGTPVCLGVLTFPIVLIDKISENLIYTLCKFWKLIVVSSMSACIGVVLLYILPYRLIFSVLTFFLDMTTTVASGIMNCLSFYLVLAIVVGYLTVVIFYWNSDAQPILEYLSLPMWLMLLLYLTAVAGSFREPLFCLLILLVVVGFVTNENNKAHPDPETDVDQSYDGLFVSTTKYFQRVLFDDSGDSSIRCDQPERHEKVSDETEESKKDKLNIKLKLSEQNLSNLYLYCLFVICVAVQLMVHWTKMISFVVLLLAFLIVKYIGYRLGFCSFFSNGLTIPNSWISERRDVLLPGPIRGLWTLILKGDSKCMNYIDRAIDETISVIVIVMMFVLVICATVFLSFQIYTESVHLADLTSNLINRTIVHNPALQDLLPAGLEDEIQDTMNSALDNAYKYGRNYTIGLVKSLIQEEDETKSQAIEQQVLDLIDNLYNTWMARNNQSASVDDVPKSGTGTFDSLVEGLTKPGVLNLSFITEFVKENIGTLMSVMDSLYVVLKGNINLISNLVTSFFSVVFVGGTAVLNFIVNSIIFFTALIYLLCASSKQYKPVELIGSMLPSSSGTALGEAFNEAVNSVFAATFKRAMFYGMYTWLIHTVLTVQMVYIPSVLAAVLGAIPFLGTYWACFPAIIELWLVNGDVISAIIMLALSFLPMSFVDGAINAEIKSGHPYLTALAIAGGMFCLGMEGALVGPILLCMLSVVFKMYGSFMSETPNDHSSPRRYPLKRMFSIS